MALWSRRASLLWSQIPIRTISRQNFKRSQKTWIARRAIPSALKRSLQGILIPRFLIYLKEPFPILKIKVTWLVNGIPLTESEKIRFICEDGICILTIQDVSRHFDGIVTCQGKNRLGTANCDARLRVRVPPVPPQFERPLEDRTVTENSAVMFEVDVIGYPEPKVEFFLKGRPLVNGQNGVEIKQLDGHYQLTIQDCQIDSHDGELMARASNEHGQAESRARLTVEPEEEQSRSAPTFIKVIYEFHLL
jgi:hypothetical protein